MSASQEQGQGLQMQQAGSAQDHRVEGMTTPLEAQDAAEMQDRVHQAQEVQTGILAALSSWWKQMKRTG